MAITRSKSAAAVVSLRLPDFRPVLEQFYILSGAAKAAGQTECLFDESIGTGDVTMHDGQAALIRESHGDQILPVRGSKGRIVVMAVLGRLAEMVTLDFDLTERQLGQCITKGVGKFPVGLSGTQSNHASLWIAPHPDENLTVGIQCNCQCARSVNLLGHIDGFANHSLTRIVERATPIGNCQHNGGAGPCILKIPFDTPSSRWSV
jgi:hypothetical protein